ncbi:MAG: hypothetical protein VX248_08255 [Pseudomonadota bacterium]|nr:hypothetical protein [Pseudomonadota bacterium]
MKINFFGILSSIFFTFFPYSVYSETSNFELYLQLLENGDIEQFEDISKDNPTALLEMDQFGITLLEYVIFNIDDDYRLHGYPEVAMSLIDEDFQVSQEYKGTLIDRIIYATRSIDKDKIRVDLNEDMKSDLDRSIYVKLLYHVLMTSNGGQPAISEDQAVLSILLICDPKRYSTTYTESSYAKALSQIYRAISSTLRLGFEGQSKLNILDPGCIQSFTKHY